jgi:phage gp29-like protein
MAKTTTATAKPLLDTEVANRLRDPFETAYMGLLRSNDPLLLEKGENVEIYRDLKRDGKVFAALQKRVGALVGRPWSVRPVEEGHEADAETLTDILTAINFDAICRDLLDALVMGFAVSEVVWTVISGRIVPQRVIKRRQRRFVYVQTDENAGPELRLLTKENMLTGVELPERKFIVHRCNPEDDNPYGTGLGLQLYWPVFFKRKGIISWNKLNDRFGSPTPWGKYPRNATPKEKSTLFDALKAMSNDGALMTPEGMQLELLESKLTGSVSTQQSLCEYMDDWIAEVVLGQEPRAHGGGALAAASKERQAVRLDLVQADSDLLSDTLNGTLLAWICEYNGLAPCVVDRQIEEEEDRKAESEADKNLYDMGWELDEAAMREKYGDGWRRRKMPATGEPPGGALANQAETSGSPMVAVDGKNPPKTEEPAAANFAEAARAASRDAIDALVDAETADWEQLLDPLLAPLQAALDEAARKGETAAELIARLPDLLALMDPDALAERLAHAAAIARLAGNAGIPLEDDATREPPATNPSFSEATPANMHQVHIHLPAGMVNVQNDVHVPEQGTPTVIVHNAFTVPEQPPAVVQVTTPEAPAPVIHNTVNVPETVVNVSTPPRRTETTVERNAQGDIVRATQIDVDLTNPAA